MHRVRYCFDQTTPETSRIQNRTSSRRFGYSMQAVSLNRRYRLEAWKRRRKNGERNRKKRNSSGNTEEIEIENAASERHWKRCTDVPQFYRIRLFMRNIHWLGGARTLKGVFTLPWLWSIAEKRRMLLRHGCRHLVVSTVSIRWFAFIPLGNPLIALFCLNEAVFLVHNKVNWEQFSWTQNVRFPALMFSTLPLVSLCSLSINDVPASFLHHEDASSLGLSLAFYHLFLLRFHDGFLVVSSFPPYRNVLTM